MMGVLLRHPASLYNSGLLVVDADTGEIEHAKGCALRRLFPKLAVIESCFGYPLEKCPAGRNLTNPLQTSSVTEWLCQHGISKIIILGDDRHGGIHAAALSGLELGYDVYVVDDATVFADARTAELFQRRLWASGGIVISARHFANELMYAHGPSSQ